MSRPRLAVRYRAAVRAMSRDARRVFWMHRIQDRPIVEIADLLGRRHEDIEDLLAEAIAHIDRALGDAEDGD